MYSLTTFHIKHTNIIELADIKQLRDKDNSNYATNIVYTKIKSSYFFSTRNNQNKTSSTSKNTTETKLNICSKKMFIS